MVQLTGESENTLNITPYHPVYKDNSWKFPIDISLVNLKRLSVMKCLHL